MTGCSRWTTSGTVTGRVIDASDGRPLAEATVTVVPGKGKTFHGPCLTRKSAEDGHFRVPEGIANVLELSMLALAPDDPPGAIVIQKQGYAPLLLCYTNWGPENQIDLGTQALTRHSGAAAH
jgi:hypothetical protein